MFETRRRTTPSSWGPPARGWRGARTCAWSVIPIVATSPSIFAHSCDAAYFNPSITASSASHIARARTYTSSVAVRDALVGASPSPSRARDGASPRGRLALALARIRAGTMRARHSHRSFSHPSPAPCVSRVVANAIEIAHRRFRCRRHRASIHIATRTRARRVARVRRRRTRRIRRIRRRRTGGIRFESYGVRRHRRERGGALGEGEQSRSRAHRAWRACVRAWCAASPSRRVRSRSVVFGRMDGWMIVSLSGVSEGGWVCLSALSLFPMCKQYAHGARTTTTSLATSKTNERT